MRIVPLDRSVHDRTSFDCGSEPLNLFLKLTANQLSDKDHAKTYALINPQQPKQIIGFYTLTMVNIQLSALPSGIQKKHKYTESAGLIARLAVDKRFQRQHFGSKLLIDALLRLKQASEIVGFPLIFVDAKDGKAEFYQQYGFQPIDARRLFMTIASIRQMSRTDR